MGGQDSFTQSTDFIFKSVFCTHENVGYDVEKTLFFGCSVVLWRTGLAVRTSVLLTSGVIILLFSLYM